MNKSIDVRTHGLYARKGDDVMKNYVDMTLEELLAERNDIYGAIQNEKIWALGSNDEWEANMHMNNVEDLRAELRHVIMIIDWKRKGRI